VSHELRERVGAGADVVFEALADPTRRAVMRSLSRIGPSTLAELTARLPVSRQAVSKHLALLQEAGLVRPDGREVRGRRYAFTPGPLADAMDWMVEIGADWDSRLARLKTLAERPH
jgi:DNA-binding transcriptional ArsR family regulator